MQRLESPNKKKIIKCMSTTSSKNNLKIPLKENNNSVINFKNNLPSHKPSENNFTRLFKKEIYSNITSKSRPFSKQTKRNNSQQYSNLIGMNSKKYFNKHVSIQNDFDNFFKKVTENIKITTNNNSINMNNNKENCIVNEHSKNLVNVENPISKENDSANLNNKDIKKINSNYISNNKASDKYLKYDFKYDKDKLLNNYVTLDLFNLKKKKFSGNDNINDIKSERTKNQIIKVKNPENSFKNPINNDKKLISENINSINSGNSSIYPKFSLKSDSNSKSKVTVSSKQTKKK